VHDDLREALGRLECSGELKRIYAPLSADFELAATLWKLRHGPTLLFENVSGHSAPVLGNLLNRREKLATALQIPADQLQDRAIQALHRPIAPDVVDDGPCLDVQYPLDADLTTLFPVPLISEHDGGRYISAGVLISRDPETRRLNLAICRMQVHGSRSVGIFMAPTHSRGFLEVHRRSGSTMEVAVAIGVHPAILAASQFLTPLDESHVAGGLFGAPVHMVRAKTVDVDVPAYAEIVLEGIIDPAVDQEEGPFGEFPGTYAPRRANPVIDLTSVTSRRNPIFQMIVGGRHPEHLVTGAIAREAGLLNDLRTVVPGVRAVRLTEGGTCRFHAVVSMTKRFAGEGRLALIRALTSQDLLKHVVVVDDDIDIANAGEVEWAIATRARADEDLIVIPGMKSNPVDPMAVGRTISKVGIDATSAERDEAVTDVGVPSAVTARLEDRWGEIFG
jgi:2,5-furandicarboxylate decarboxylase 1